VRAAGAPLVVDEHILDRLEPDERTLGALLGLVGVVLEATLGAVEDEPTALPLSDHSGAGAQLRQIAVTGARRELDMLALVQTMTGRLDEPTQVYVTVTHRQVARQRTRSGRLEHTSAQ